MLKNRKIIIGLVLIVIIIILSILLIYQNNLSSENVQETVLAGVKVTDVIHTEINAIDEQISYEEGDSAIAEGKSIEKPVNSQHDESYEDIIDKEQPSVDTVEQPEDMPAGEEEGLPEQSIYIGRQPPAGYVEPGSQDPRQIESQLALKDTYQSNIIIIQEDLWNIDINDYNWYHPSSQFNLYNYGYTVDFVCYAILTYYDGEVPCDYYVDLDTDKHNIHSESAQIFEVQTYGDKPLNICIDMYNYKIRVEEGIKKED